MVEYGRIRTVQLTDNEILLVQGILNSRITEMSIAEENPAIIRVYQNVYNKLNGAK